MGRSFTRRVLLGVRTVAGARYVVAAHVLAVTLAGSGCQDDSPPVAVITSVVPDRGYSDRPIRLLLRGGPFIPAYEVDLRRGTRAAISDGFTGRVGQSPGSGLRDFSWHGFTELAALLDPGLPEGSQEIHLTDPHGVTTQTAVRFLSLGPDQDRPHLTFGEPLPETLLAPRSMVTGLIHADDPAPGTLLQVGWQAVGPDGLAWAQGDCPLVPSRQEVLCPFTTTVPAAFLAGQAITFRALATDNAAAPNSVEQMQLHILRAPPALTQVTPLRGGTAGGTELLIRGSGFLSGTIVRVDGVPLGPQGGTVVDEGTVVGHVPPHGPGAVTVVVQSPLGTAELPAGFVYQSPPQILTVEPAVGEGDGGTVVRVRGRDFTATTQIYFGTSLADARPLDKATPAGTDQINGKAPGGAGRTTVWAFDPDLGWTRLMDGFGWQLK